MKGSIIFQVWLLEIGVMIFVDLRVSIKLRFDFLVLISVKMIRTLGRGRISGVVAVLYSMQ